MSRPLEVLAFQESNDGTTVRVMFGYHGRGDAPTMARYQMQFDAPVTTETLDATLADLQTKADAVDALEQHYAPSVLAVNNTGLSLVN